MVSPLSNRTVMKIPWKVESYAFITSSQDHASSAYSTETQVTVTAQIILWPTTSVTVNYRIHGSHRHPNALERQGHLVRRLKPN